MLPFRCLVFVCCALLVAGCGHDQSARSPQSAHGLEPTASKVRLPDARDDLWIEHSQTQTPSRTPPVPNGDAVGVVLDRTADALVVTVYFVDIEARASRDWGVDFEMDIPEDHLGREAQWDEYRFVGTHTWKREANYSKYSTEDSLGPICRRLEAQPDFTAETVTMRVPDRCFDKARWVVVKGLYVHAGHTVDFVGTDGIRPQRTLRLVAPG